MCSVGCSLVHGNMFRAGGRGWIAMRGIVIMLVMWMLGVAAWAAPSCNTHKEFPAVDLSQPVTTITTKSGKTGVQAFKAIGIRTIARYYDWVDAETTCKSLFPKESDAIIAAGFSVLTIFQHENSDPETFLDKSRGAKDAREA
jgi:accessory colonization factor AcfC